MKTVKIKMIQNHSWGKKGSEIEVSEDVAKRLVHNKFAQIVSDAKEATIPDRKPVTEPKAKRGTRKTIEDKSLSKAGDA